MTHIDKRNHFMELFDTFVKGNIHNADLELLLSLCDDVEKSYRIRNDWIRLKFLINLKLSQRKLASSDIESCRNGLQDCHKLLVERKNELIKNNEKSDEINGKIWNSDNFKLNLLALEVLILDDNFDTAQIVLRKCESYGMTKGEESHLGKVLYLAGSRLFKINNYKLSIFWLETSFSIGRRLNNWEINNAAGNLLLKLMVDKREWRRVKALIDLLPYSHSNQLYLLRYEIEEGNHIEASYMTRNLLEKTTLNYDQAYQLLSIVNTRNDLVELLIESSIGENWSQTEQEEWLASLVCFSSSELCTHRTMSNYIQWANKNIDQTLHYSSVVLKFVEDKLEDLFKSQEYAVLEKWINALIFLAQIAKEEELFCHFVKCMVVLQLKQNKCDKAHELLEQCQSIFPLNSKLVQRRLWVSLKVENVDVCSFLIKALQEKSLKLSEDFWFAFIEILSNCMETKSLKMKDVQTLFSLLADFGYFGSLELLKCGILIFCRLEDAKTVVHLLNIPSVKYLILENFDIFCSKKCWNLGIKCTDKSLRYQLLRLTYQLLPPKDPSFFSIRLVCIAAGLSCLSSQCIAGPQSFRQLSTDIVQILESQCLSRTIKRAALLYQFRLFLLTEGQHEIFRSILRKLEELGDVTALETLSLMAANQKNYTMDIVAVDAILKATLLNSNFKENLLLCGLEILCSGQGHSPQLSSIVDQLLIIWKETPVKRLIGRAITNVWNAWVKQTQETACFNFRSALVTFCKLISNDNTLSAHQKPTQDFCNIIRNILE